MNAGVVPHQLRDYAYSPLPQNHIRLVRLHSTSSFDDPIVCKLDIVDLAAVRMARADMYADLSSIPEAPNWYNALSYVWGEPTSPEFIVILDGEPRKMSVRQNLFDALRRVRLSDKSCSLWIDRISINQEDVLERQSQVALMDVIFSSAYSVFVWLGETSATYDTLLPITTLGKQMEEWVQNMIKEGVPIPRRPHLDEIMQIPDKFSDQSRLIQSILTNPWFRRVWTIQEIVLAKKAIVMHGCYSTNYAYFDYLGGAIERYSTVGNADKIWIVSAAQALSKLFAIRSWLSGNPVRGNDKRDHTSLLQLVFDFQSREATDMRDKIWALLGIANDAQDLLSEIDYVNPWQDVYTKITHWICRQYQSLSFLQLVHIKEQSHSGTNADGLPSWAPDFRKETPLLDAFYTSRHLLWNERVPELFGAGKIYFASGASETVSRTGSDPSQLIIQGLKVGTVTSISESSGNLVAGVAIGPGVEDGGVWHQLVVNEVSENGLYVSTGETIEKAYSRLRIGDVLPGEGSGRRSRKTFPWPLPRSNVRLCQSPEESRWQLFDENGLGSCILRATTRRRLFVTDTGYMGLTHQTNALGDEIWVLLGAHMPVTLRSVSPRANQNSSYTLNYLFRGECYVHGIMDGEFLVQTRKKIDPDWKEDYTWLDDLYNGASPLPVQSVSLF